MVPNKCLGREPSAGRQSNNNGNGICISLEASVNFLESQRIYPPNSTSARFSLNSLYCSSFALPLGPKIALANLGPTIV